MKITKETVHHLANLARLRLTDEEVDQYQKELSHILTLVSSLKECDVSELGTLQYTTKLQNVVRKDNVTTTPNTDGLLEAFPEHEERSLKVDAIL